LAGYGGKAKISLWGEFALFVVGRVRPIVFMFKNCAYFLQFDPLCGKWKIMQWYTPTMFNFVR